MEKKEFLEITKKVFQDYGFKVDRKYYYLDLDDVFIVATIFPHQGSHILSYNFSIKAIHDEKERKPNDIFTGYDCWLEFMFNSKGRNFIDYSNITKEEYLNDLKEMLPRYFDPFKNNALKYIVEARFIPGKNASSHRFMILPKAREYLGVDFSK